MNKSKQNEIKGTFGIVSYKNESMFNKILGTLTSTLIYPFYSYQTQC